MSSITENVVDFIQRTKFEDLPTDALREAKKCILDCIGVALAGSVQPIGRIIKKYLEATAGKQQSTVIGYGLKTSAPDAAFANGTFAHALDYDDDNYSLVGHPSAPVLPAVLATGEVVQSSGKDALTAYMVGVEVECKIGAVMSSSLHKRRLPSTGLVGTFGAVASAGKILHLNSEELANALGIAGSEAAAVQKNSGTMTKPFHAGRAAQNGVVAALLAKEGFTASKDILGPGGWCQSMIGESSLPNIGEKLGKPWEVLDPGINIKTYPCVYTAQPAILGTLGMMKEYVINPDEVASVRVGMNPHGKYAMSYSEPKTGLQGKFSAPYVVAVAALNRPPTLEDFTDATVTARMQETKFVDFMKKVELYVDPDVDAKIPYHLGDQLAKVTIKMKDGREHVREQQNKTLTREELMTKYRDCAGLVLKNEKIDKSIELEMKMEEVENINDLTKLLY